MTIRGENGAATWHYVVGPDTDGLHHVVKGHTHALYKQEEIGGRVIRYEDWVDERKNRDQNTHDGLQ